MGSPTIDDVAEAADVSKGTVSAVINDADTVSDSTRSRVLDVIDELNYRPRASAQRGFQRGAERSLGLIIKESANPYYANVIAGAREHANENGYSVLTASSEGSYQTEQEIVDVFVAKDVAGLIVVPVLGEETDVSYLYDLKRRNFPFILLEEIQGVQCNLVDIDNVRALKRAALYLIEAGHENLVHFAGPEYSMHSRERAAGVREAYSESPLAFSAERVIPVGARLEDGYETGLEYFRDRSPADRPTAVLCYNDLVALGLMRALSELGIRVPDEVSVMGCDNIGFAQYGCVPLSSIDIPKVEMGRAAADILVRHVESDRKLQHEKQRLEADLVLRDSTRSL